MLQGDANNLFGWAKALMAQHLSSGQLQRFKGVGGVAGFTAVRWASKEGHHPVPVGIPDFAEGGVLLIPTLSNGNERLLCLSLGRIRVAGSAVSGNRSALSRSSISAGRKVMG